jgi:hypothetical protein
MNGLLLFENPIKFYSFSILEIVYHSEPKVAEVGMKGGIVCS